MMRTLTAKEAKYGFGRLSDPAPTEPLIVARHGRPVVVVMAIVEYGWLKAIEEAQRRTEPCTPASHKA